MNRHVEQGPGSREAIPGVPTSICAFIGRAQRGPTNQPVEIRSFEEFERIFGGLDGGHPMGHSVRDFFLSGGRHAVVVRLFNAPEGTSAAGIEMGGLRLEAVSPGTWGNRLRARVDRDSTSDPPGAADGDPDRDHPFNLSVRDTATGETECFPGLTLAESPRRADRVLQDESRLVRVVPPLPSTVPAPHGDAGPRDDVWTDDRLSEPVSTKGQDSAPLDREGFEGSRRERTGLFALEKTDLFNLLCIPPDVREGTTPSDVYRTALDYCVERRAVLIVDPPAHWGTASEARDGLDRDLGFSGPAARNAALYFPRILLADAARRGRVDTFVPCGLVAGVMARTDARRGVWKAPAGTEATLQGVQGLSVELTSQGSSLLNSMGINGLRTLPAIGPVVWGARTLHGADGSGDEYKYLPVRRLALFIEESLLRGTRWVVFEPNGEPLWAEVRAQVGAFMQDLFRRGAFQGATPGEAYFVKCDAETTSPRDIEEGIVNVLAGFAPLRPAEFVIIRIRQVGGRADS